MGTDAGNWSIASPFSEADGSLVATSSRSLRARAIKRFDRRSGALAAEVVAHDGWTLTRRVPGHGRLELFRARTSGELGPGCYLFKRPRSPGDAIAEAMLAREAAVSRAVINAHLVSVLSEGKGGTVAFNVLPFLDGVPLGHIFARRSVPLAIVPALSIGRQIASALSALHAGGWLHGRLGPDHVIVSSHLQATLINLTATRRLESSECDGKEWPRKLLPYLAPEVLSGCSRLTAAVDIYALGVVLYEVISGWAPFAMCSERALIQAHLRERPCDLRSIRSEVSVEVDELVRRMLLKEALRRPSADEIVRWLVELEIEELA